MLCTIRNIKVISNYCNFILKFTGSPEMKTEKSRQIVAVHEKLFYLFQGCDAAYLTNIKKEFENHPNYCKGEDRRKWDKEFGIRHYAGTVVYRYSPTNAISTNAVSA